MPRSDRMGINSIYAFTTIYCGGIWDLTHVHLEQKLAIAVLSHHPSQFQSQEEMENSYPAMDWTRDRCVWSSESSTAADEAWKIGMWEKSQGVSCLRNTLLHAKLFLNSIHFSPPVAFNVSIFLDWGILLGGLRFSRSRNHRTIYFTCHISPSFWQKVL